MAKQVEEKRMGARPAPLKDAGRQRELEQILEEIESGAIADLDELDARDLALLREYYGEGEELQALLDRLGGDEER